MKNTTPHPARAFGRALFCVSALTATLAVARSEEREAPPVRQVQEIPLPGVQGRIDHFTLDLKRKRVIFSGLGNNTVQVVDAFAGKQIAQIDGLSEPQGTYYLADGDKLYVANAADGHVNVYDGTKFNLLTTIDFGEDPDNLRYEAATKRLYVGYGDGAIGTIDTTTDKRLEKVDFKLSGHPEGFQLESKGPRIFVNIADSKNIAVIDRNTGAVTYWSLPAGHLANFPMTLDEEGRRIIIGTRRPSRATILDMDSGKIVASLPAPGDMDDIFFDALRKRIYVSGGEGFIGVFQQKDANTYETMGKFATPIGTRTGVWYVKRDRLYLAAPAGNGLGARLIVFEPQD
ncbi:MAG: repeat containing protein [Lacunisphaera sp.]|nr:repeat containing protein [Lacunisphaera sp.]